MATQYTFAEQNINGAPGKDETIAGIIKPYKDSLDKQMNVVLAISDTILTRAQPESDLGNLMCDLILKKSEDYSGQKIDFTFLNYGGIRLPNLPKGNITLGNIIELMPFENLIDVMQVSGKTLDTLFNHMAARGGWQVSGARYTIKGGRAVNVFINGQPLDINKEYTMAVSDYLAQGGDNCSMLTYVPRTIYKKSLRDALIDGLIEMNQRGEHINSIIDGRVSKAE